MSTQEEMRALWVSTKERIASFHEEAGYEKIVFADANHFFATMSSGEFKSGQQK